MCKPRLLVLVIYAAGELFLRARRVRNGLKVRPWLYSREERGTNESEPERRVRGDMRCESLASPSAREPQEVCQGLLASSAG